ncbi:MAG: hypothetical protein AAF391_06450 [Bacteroidota bacterium]
MTLLVSLAIGCANDDIQLPDQELLGTIDGEDWEYDSANGFLQTTDFQYLARFLSDKETVSDPCALPRPGRMHVKAIFRPAIGSFTVTPQAISNNQVQVAFEISPAKTLIAGSGFMEIFDINNQIVFGYLQAIVDDENMVEGAFQVRLCN